MSCHSRACKDHLFFKFIARLIPLQYLLNLKSNTATVYVEMYSSCLIVTRPRTGRPRNRGSVPSRGAFPGGKAAGTWGWAFHLAPRFRMSVAVPSLPYVPSLHAGGQLNLFLLCCTCLSVHVSPNLRRVFKNKNTKVGSPHKRELKAFPSNTSATCNFLVYRDNKACYSHVLCHSLFQWSCTISCSVNLINIRIFFFNFHSFFSLHASTEKESSYIRAYTVYTGVCVWCV